MDGTLGVGLHADWTGRGGAPPPKQELSQRAEALRKTKRINEAFDSIGAMARALDLQAKQRRDGDFVGGDFSLRRIEEQDEEEQGMEDVSSPLMGIVLDGGNQELFDFAARSKPI